MEMTREIMYDQFKKLKSNPEKVKYLVDLKEMKQKNPHVFRNIKINLKQFSNLIREYSSVKPFSAMNRDDCRKRIRRSLCGSRKEKEIMKKFFATIIILNTLLFVGLSSVAKADDKTSAIIGHVITQAIQGNDMDHSEVLTNELNALMHQFSIDIMETLLQSMPNILDSISAQLRQELDKQYKCSLQDDDYKNKECI